MASKRPSLVWSAATDRTEIPKRLIQYLNENEVRYEILHQPKESSRRNVSAKSPRYSADVVIVKAGQQHLVAVVPIKSRVDLKEFAHFVGEPARLVTEEESKWLFPDCAIGAIPPFGHLYGLPTFVDSELAKNDYIVFAAGTHSDYIKVSYSAYEKMVRPRIGSVAIKASSGRSRSFEIRKR
jgi:Ala-tRNA(Pro) deacylase